MHDVPGDAIALPNAVSLSRRTSLIGLGGLAAIATIARQSPTRAGKVGKRVKKTCRKQIDKCQSSVSSFCAQPNLTVPREACEAAILPCCSSFRNCNAGEAYDCIGDALLSLVPPASA